MAAEIEKLELGREVLRLAEVMVDVFGTRTNLMGMAVRLPGIRIYTCGGRFMEKVVLMHHPEIKVEHKLSMDVLYCEEGPSGRGVLTGVLLKADGEIVVNKRRAAALLKKFQELLPLEGLAAVVEKGAQS